MDKTPGMPEAGKVRHTQGEAVTEEEAVEGGIEAGDTLTGWKPRGTDPVQYLNPEGGE
jgi:hypothetical protein